MGATGNSFQGRAATKFAYRLSFKKFRAIFTARPTVLSTEEYIYKNNFISW
jgi:hypothetical protein